MATEQLVPKEFIICIVVVGIIFEWSYNKILKQYVKYTMQHI